MAVQERSPLPVEVFGPRDRLPWQANSRSLVPVGPAQGSLTAFDQLPIHTKHGGFVPNDAAERWVQAYPRKQNVAAAKRMFWAVMRSGIVSFDEIMRATMQYAWAMSRTEQRYIKLPTTWLVNECWEDDPQLSEIQPLNYAQQERADQKTERDRKKAKTLEDSEAGKLRSMEQMDLRDWLVKRGPDGLSTDDLRSMFTGYGYSSKVLEERLQEIHAKRDPNTDTWRIDQIEDRNRRAAMK